MHVLTSLKFTFFYPEWKNVPKLYEFVTLTENICRCEASDNDTDSSMLSNPRMFPVWDLVIRIFAREILLDMDRVVSTFSC